MNYFEFLKESGRGAIVNGRLEYKCESQNHSFVELSVRRPSDSLSTSRSYSARMERHTLEMMKERMSTLTPILSRTASTRMVSPFPMRVVGEVVTEEGMAVGIEAVTVEAVTVVAIEAQCRNGIVEEMI